MSKFHLAGIIPVAGQPLDFKMPWPDSMMPLNEDYLAVEHSVVECAYAGCETIWIVCNDDIQPLIKSRYQFIMYLFTQTIGIKGTAWAGACYMGLTWLGKQQEV